MAEGSIKSRIAALNLEEVHTPVPGAKPSNIFGTATTKKKPPPPPPPSARPPAYSRHTVNNPPVLSHAPTSARQLGNQPVVVVNKTASLKTSPALPPRLPPRSGSTLPQTPTLPPRKSSESSVRRRESSESISTITSSVPTLSLGSAKKYGAGHSNGSAGTLHRVRAPAFDPTKLPPLPPKRTCEDSKQSNAILNAMKSKRDYVPARALPPQVNTPDVPARLPLPARKPTLRERSSQPAPILPQRQVSNDAPRANRVVAPPPPPPQRPPQRSALEMGFNNKAPSPPPTPSTRPPVVTSKSTPSPNAPPPIPLSSRPNLEAIMASKPKPGAVGGCLKCRDFSAPDSHAAKFPRTQLPSSDVGWLAHQLCSQFSSPTDKARVIFTWLHHNVDYDVHSFFNGTVSPTTPEKTIASGLAVCEGYAGLFAALALKAGLEAIVCSGACKGFGYTPLEPGQAVPPYKSTHAWNAVKIDNGEWKLIDPCWGAGHIGCRMRGEGYIRSFNARQFTMDNDEFGLRHFPGDASQQLRNDGCIISYEEFMRDDQGGRVQVYGDAFKEHGLGERTFEPPQAQIKANDPYAPAVIRFKFSTVCPHWDNAHHGKGPPYIMLLSIAGRDGRKPDYKPFNTDGHTWWLDVPRVELGVPGQKVAVNAITEFSGQNARGMSIDTWNNKQGYSCKFGGVAAWEVI